MNIYLELKRKNEKLLNDFPMTFAFSNKQFVKAKEKLGVTDNDELLTIPCGGIIRKTDQKAYGELIQNFMQSTEEAQKDDDYLYQGFLYELGNHEYCITGDPESTLQCFGLTIEDVTTDIRLWDIFKKARKQYLGELEV